MNSILGIDIGTTSIAAVVIDAATGDVLQTRTLPNPGDLPSSVPGVHEQDPLAIAQAVDSLIDAFPPMPIAWTGQMHSILAVDEHLRPLTPLITWRDARCAPPTLAAGVIQTWLHDRLPHLHKCLPIPSFLIARRTGHCLIDETFLHSLGPCEALGIPPSLLPTLTPNSMIGDNQAGVFAALHFAPNAAVINLGTSGQLSIVGPGPGGEIRPFPGHRILRCRASHVGGRAFADLQKQLGIPYPELNQRAHEPAIAACIQRIVDDLVGDMDISAAQGLVGVGNALRLNPALRAAIEERFHTPCILPPIHEMAAYGAALTLLQPNA